MCKVIVCEGRLEAAITAFDFRLMILDF